MRKPFEDWAAAQPDDVFPAMSTGHIPMITLIDRGWQLVVKCTGCATDRVITSREVAEHHAVWLTRDIWGWARQIHCQACGGRRLTIHAQNDASAAAAYIGPAHTPCVQRVRRLNDYLALGGMRLDDVAYLLRDMEIGPLLDAGLTDAAELFRPGFRTAEHYRPTRSRP